MPLGIEKHPLLFRNQCQKHLCICLRMVQTQIAMVVSGENLQSAAPNRVIQQFSGCADRGLFFAAENDMYLGLRIPESRFYGIGTVAFKKGDHIFFGNLAGIPVIVIKQFLGDAQIGGLHFGKPLLLDQAVAHPKGGSNQRMG